MRDLPAGLGTVLVLLAALALAAALGSGGGAGALGGEQRLKDAPLADAVPYDGRSPREPAGEEIRLLVALPRPPLARLEDAATMPAAGQRAYVRSLEEEAASLRSALEARGVPLRDPVTFSRAWHGFAATIRARDSSRLSTLGLGTRAVRRFYPTVSEPVAAPVRLPPPRRARGAAVALLAGGVDAGALGPAGIAGYDAVERDADPAPGSDPRAPGRPELSGTALAAVLTGAGARVRPVRVAAMRPGSGATGVEEYARTDELLAGMENALDPDGDGDLEDRAEVVLVGVNAPYAGWADAPEAQAAAAAARLGTRVVAGAGHEARGVPGQGTIGSPGGAPRVLTVGAAASGPAATVALRAGDLRLDRAALLAGAEPGGELELSEPVEADAAPDLLRPGAPPLEGRAALVRAGSNPVAQATAAAGAGAAAVLLAEPRPDRILPSVPAGRLPVPVLGVTGAAAEALLRAGGGVTVSAGRPARGPVPRGEVRASPFSSSGPALSGAAKPELVAHATAAIPLEGGTRVVAGAGVAGALVAAALAASDFSGREGAVLREVRRRLGGRAAPAARVRPAPPERLTLGVPTVDRARGRPRGVRFTLGAFDRGLPGGGVGTRLLAAARLDLTLETPEGDVVRRLTPPGGELGLLPGEYAYTLPPAVLAALPPGSYRFVVRGRAPRQTGLTSRRSAPFAVR